VSGGIRQQTRGWVSGGVIQRRERTGAAASHPPAEAMRREVQRGTEKYREVQRRYREVQRKYREVQREYREVQRSTERYREVQGRW